MHMADALVSPAVAVTMYAASAAAAGVSLVQLHKEEAAAPELLQCASAGAKNRCSRRAALAILAASALVIGGGLSLLASSNPDGLEWSLFGNEEAGYSANMGLDEEAYGAESAAAEKAAAVQEKTSLLPDYNFAGSDSAAGTSVSGLVGCALVAALAACISLAGRAARKRSGKKQASAG